MFQSKKVSFPVSGITPAMAAQELLRRRGLINSPGSKFIRALRSFAAGRMDPDVLLQLCEKTFGLKLPITGLCPGHSSPGIYLLDALSCRGEDVVVWACRGGGKTAIGALLSLIESIIYDECETIILGGSLEQSKRMYEHVIRYIDMGSLHPLLREDPIQAHTLFSNGSKISVATASQRSVRGPHVPRLRFDEVDEFDPRIYQAALKMRQSRARLNSALHIYSTMHNPGGLMNSIVSDLPEQTDGQNRRLYVWCIWDVAEKCEGRDCGTCTLEPDCKGICKNAHGWISIDDIIKIRTDPASDENSWQSEMLCRKPGTKSLIWPDYDESIHLSDNIDVERINQWKLRFHTIVAGVDWGYENPSAIIVIGEDAEGLIYVLEEHYESRLLCADLGEIAYKLMKKWNIEAFFCDPSRPDNIHEWRQMGLPAYSGNHHVERGIKTVASLFQLLPPHNRPRIQIARSCTNLRREILSYRRRGDHVSSSSIVSDGGKETIIKKNDHACDALRYGIMGLYGRPKWST